MCRLLLLTVAAVAVLEVSGASGSEGSVQSRWVIRDLGTLPSTGNSEAIDVNERGQVLGRSGGHGFLWQRGRTTDLGDVWPVAINDRGQVVWQHPTSTGQHVFLWENGSAKDLGTLGGRSSFPVAINDHGQIVGSADTTTGAAHVFFWENGVMSDLGTDCWVEAINNHTQMVGHSPPTGPRLGCLLDHGVVTGLGTLGGDSEAYAINERRQVIGASGATVDAYHAFFWQNGTMTDLGALVAAGLNNRGLVILNRNSPRLGHAFLWQNGKLTDLGTLAGGATWASAINESGQIVGHSGAAPRTNHAFLWQQGKLTDLGTLPGYKGSRAVAINDHGQIVGFSSTKNGTRHAVLWTLRPR